MPVLAKPIGAARRLARRIGGMMSLALVPMLLVQGAALWLLHDNAEIEIPAWAAARLRPRLAAAGLDCTWSSAKINASGRLELTDATLGVPGGTDPIFEAGRLVVVVDAFDLLAAHRVTPQRLWLDRGRLFCPAATSPTGRREIALDRVRAALHREGDRLVVEALQADCGGIPLVAHGRILPPGHAAGATPPTAPATPHSPLRPAAQAAARLVALRPWLAAFDGASLNLSGQDTPAGVRLDLTGRADAFTLPGEGVHAEKLRLAFGVLWDANGLRPDAEAVFGFQRLTIDRPKTGALPALAATCGNAEMRAAFGPRWELPSAATLAAHRPEVNGMPLDRVVVRAGRDAASGRLSLRGLVNWEHQTVRFLADSHPDRGDLAVRFDARVRPDELVAHPIIPPRLIWPRELEGFSVPGIARVQGRVEFDPGWKFREAAVSLDGGALDLKPASALAFRGEVRYTPGRLELHDILLLNANQRVEAFVDCGLERTSPFRLIIRGNAYPGQVSPFVGAWWDDIFKNIDASPGHPGFIDIDVAGRWSGSRHANIFADFRAHHLLYQKQKFDRVAVRILEEFGRVAVYDLHMANADGTHARGDLEWRYSGPGYQRESCRFHFAGKLDKAVALKLADEPELTAALADIRLTRPFEGSVSAFYHGPMSPTPGRSQLAVAVAAPGPFEAWKLPASDFSGDIRLDGRRVQALGTKFTYAGGTVLADARVHLLDDHPRLTFDAKFDDCERDAFVAGFTRMKDAVAPGAPAKPAAPVAPPAAPDKARIGEKLADLVTDNAATRAVHHAAEGIGDLPVVKQIIEAVPAPHAGKTAAPPAKPASTRISGTIAGRVSLPDMATLDAKGRFVVRDPSIPDLPVLGAISRGLDAMGLPSAIYKFTSVDGDFFIRENGLYLPRAALRGPDARVDIRGHYQLATGNLNFRALLVPAKRKEIPVYDAIRNMVGGTTKIFPVDIRGTLDKPEWSVDISPSALVSKPRLDALGTPPPAKPDDGKW